MRAYGEPAHRRLAELADVCGIKGSNDREKAEAFINWIEEANEKMGLPNQFDMIQDKDIKQMIAWASKEANPLYPVPVLMDKEELEYFYRAVMSKS
jgi:alcohol dehydrogenase class IV